MGQAQDVSSQTLKRQELDFSDVTPVAPYGLGGLIRDHFSNGRLFATVTWYGGLSSVSYWGSQHPGASELFSAGLESAWFKLFRIRIGLSARRYYLPWKNTKLYPFGMSCKGEISGVGFTQDLLLLPDTLVQRCGIRRSTKQHALSIEMLHQESICRVRKPHRTWSNFEWHRNLNAMIACCSDCNPSSMDDAGLAQQGFVLPDRGKQTQTWIGIGCSKPMNMRVAGNRFKIYLTSQSPDNKEVAFFVTFATDVKKLEQKIRELSHHVNRECDDLIQGYHKRLDARPHIDVGDKVLNSAFNQFPEVIEHVKVLDKPGAVRATQSGYFVWGWDGMTPLISSPLANEPQYAANTFRFFQTAWDRRYGIPHAFSSTFLPRMKAPFPAQAQYIASLYHYVSITGDLKLVRQVMPVCKNILKKCRLHEIRNSGLVSSYALWPDLPEFMGENGRDISSMNNSLLYQGLRAMEYLSAVLGDHHQARVYQDWAKRLRKSFIRYFYDKDKGFFITSCSSEDFSPRRHYGCATIYWITPFARELVAHAPRQIADFMHDELRSAKCLLSLPQWDTAWMADGNQLGSSFPTADYFYLGVHKLLGEDRALESWLNDVKWFWSRHTAPEAFTPETENEDAFGPDNHGCKQTQTLAAWYSNFYMALCGLDFDHEGITLTPWGNRDITVQNLKLRETTVDLRIHGTGHHIGALKLNGIRLPQSCRKIPWTLFKGKKASLEILRSTKAPSHPVIVRADGLRICSLSTRSKMLEAQIDGDVSGEIVIAAKIDAKIWLNGKLFQALYEKSSGTFTLPFKNCGPLIIQVNGNRNPKFSCGRGLA